MSFKFCPECGFKFDKEYKFCPECGYQLGGEEKKPEPLFDFSEDTAKYTDEKFGGFDEQLKKQEASKIASKPQQKSHEPKPELKKVQTKTKAELLAKKKESQLGMAFARGRFDEIWPIIFPRAESGDADCQYMVGFIYWYKYCDYEKAIYWYEKATAAGSTGAMRALGDAYLNGWGGMTKNIHEAFKWYKMLADYGDEDDKAEVGRLKKEYNIK